MSSSTTLWSAWRKLCPAFRPAIVTRRSGSWFSKVFDALLRLEGGEEVAGSAALQEAEPDQRHGLGQPRGDEPAEHAGAEHEIDELHGAKGQVGPLEHALELCHGLSLPRAFSVAWKRPAAILSRSRGPDCFTRRLGDVRLEAPFSHALRRGEGERGREEHDEPHDDRERSLAPERPEELFRQPAFELGVRVVTASPGATTSTEADSAPEVAVRAIGSLGSADVTYSRRHVRESSSAIEL